MDSQKFNSGFDNERESLKANIKAPNGKTEQNDRISSLNTNPFNIGNVESVERHVKECNLSEYYEKIKKLAQNTVGIHELKPQGQ